MTKLSIRQGLILLVNSETQRRIDDRMPKKGTIQKESLRNKGICFRAFGNFRVEVELGTESGERQRELCGEMIHQSVTKFQFSMMLSGTTGRNDCPPSFLPCGFTLTLITRDKLSV